jgi:hypothetical protein
MVADALAVHAQNLYIVTGTAIPVLFVALAVQTTPSSSQGLKLDVAAIWPLVPVTLSVRIPLRVHTIGLFVMLVGEIASLAALAFDWTSVAPKALAMAGVVAGAAVVAASVAPTPTDGGHITAGGDVNVVIHPPADG